MSQPRVQVCGRNSKELLPLLEHYGLTVDEKNPEVIISYGGDGTLLGAERAWPGIPKVALRDSRHCRTCSHHSNEEILEHLANGTLKQARFRKLKATVGERELVALNDIILRNAEANIAMRFQVQIDGDDYTTRELVGDGVVVATPFGSTGYFSSITHCSFHTGFGLAFNNSTEQINHLILKENSVIQIVITRGPAVLAADNNPERIVVEKDAEIIVRHADLDATILLYDRVRFRDRRIVF